MVGVNTITLVIKLLSEAAESTRLHKKKKKRSEFNLNHLPFNENIITLPEENFFLFKGGNTVAYFSLGFKKHVFLR